MCAACCATGSASPRSDPSTRPPSAISPPSTVGRPRLAADQANARRGKAYLVLFRQLWSEPAAQRPSDLGAAGQAARAAPPVQLQAGLKAAALCYGLEAAASASGSTSRLAATTPTPSSVCWVSCAASPVTRRPHCCGRAGRHRSPAVRAFLARQRDWLVVPARRRKESGSHHLGERGRFPARRHPT